VISRDELLVQAKAFDLSEANVQRDYLFGWIISGIFRESSLAGRATLKGGNALRKGYLPGTRFSDDLEGWSSRCHYRCLAVVNVLSAPKVVPAAFVASIR
jgi:predicted nucleotidyltransferase component of viral defense system